MNRGGPMLSEKFSYEILNELCKQWDPERRNENQLSLGDAILAVHSNQPLLVKLESIL